MSTRAYIAALISMMVNAVVFGAGTIAVLSIPALSTYAVYLLPIVVVLSFTTSPFIAWAMAPMLRSGWQRQHERPLETLGYDAPGEMRSAGNQGVRCRSA